MFKIIVGVNERDEALDALRLASEIARVEDAEVIAAAAFEYYAADVMALAYPEAEKAFYEKVEERAKDALEGLPYADSRLQDTPAHGLQQLAEAEKADLIVLGSTHRGPIGRVLPGSVGELVLQAAPCEVAVAPRGYAKGEHPKIGRVGVAYDGMPESELALDEAIRIAKAADAELEVITVAPDYNPMHGGPVESLRDHYRDQLTHGMEAAREAGLEVEGVLPDGDTGDAISRQGVELDLLVLGSRGYGPLRHVLLGSTSTKVIRTAPCPVLVVPRRAEEVVHAHEAAAAATA